jgi:hypothetical protein
LSYLNNKIFRRKNAVFSLSLILMLSMTIIIAFAEPSFAQVGIPQPEKTTGYISVAPTLIGVDQEATVNLWIFPLPTNYLYNPVYSGFTGVTVTLNKPDGSKDSFKPVDGTGQFVAGQTESNGAIFFYYTPDMVGNWSISFTMPEQNLTDNTGTVLYTGCTSNTAYFTVQTDPVMAGLLNGYPWSSLPNDNTYWSYPINANNREWSQISGEWLQGRTSAYVLSNYFTGVTSRLWQPYGQGPNTPHIVWKQPLRGAGIIGGDYGSLSYYFPDYSGSIIIEGHLFRTTVRAGAANATFKCFDFSTGQLLYTASGDISCGIHLPGNPLAQNSIINGVNNSVVLANSMGSYVTPYLFGITGTNWNYYDPNSGALMRSIVNASSGFRLVDGTNLAYGAASGNLTAWDISKVANNNWPTGIKWTRPLPASNAGKTPSLFAISTEVSTIVLTTRNQYWGFNAKDGSSLWNLTLTYPVEANEAFDLYGVDDFIVFDPVDVTFNCYSMLSGGLLWSSPSLGSSSPWASLWSVYASATNDYNNVYIALPDGTVSALSLKTGKELWRSEAIPSTEYTNNVVPYWQGMLMAGGNIYAYAGYSLGYSLDPIPRQAMIVCVNATTGGITYTLNGGVFPEAAANGYVIGSSYFDGNIYCIGKGSTSTTVAAQQQMGGSLLIQGSVLDASPVSSSATLKAMCPNGVPAISDANMSAWMDYLHMQNATLLSDTPQFTGVQVTLTAVDPNGNTITMGTTTSDYKGNYGLQWTPSTPGIYHIYATFAGSTSYYTSSASTYATVASAIATVTPTSATQPEVSNTDMVMYFVATGIAIIIAIAIATFLILRRK